VTSGDSTGGDAVPAVDFAPSKARLHVMAHQRDRREFLEQLGVASAAIIGTRTLPLNAATLSPPPASGEEQ
jgi:hypothetical protein